MPELPEVETVARQLAPYLEGRTIRSARILDPRLDGLPVRALVGRPIVQVTRIDKQVTLALGATPRRPPRWLGVHLRMTGRLLWDADPPRVDRTPHLRARLRLDRGALRFVDTRRFGTLTLVDHPDRLRSGGVDPLTPRFSARQLGALIAASRSPVKTWLLRQDRLAGLGNIYVSEALWAAGIAPDRPAGMLGPDELSRLHRALRRILRKAIEHCGTTFSDFQGADGLTGSYQQYLQVYAKAGAPCPRCRTPIERVVQQQRSTFYCPRCQA